MRTSILLLAHASLAFGVIGCGSAASNDAGAGASSQGPTQPPPVLTNNADCVISADCQAGQHCDLGQCIQDCNVQSPCGTGLTCSPRARCIPPGQSDIEPPPSTQYSGSISATPSTVNLTDRDQWIDIKIAASQPGKVRYRIQLDAPHLTVAQTRGEFTDSTTIRFNVNASALKGRDVPGSIHIFTTLGNLTVGAPLHVGVTGSYTGALRYDDGQVPLGDTRLAVDIVESNGNLAVRVPSKETLLFPATATGETTGHGQFTTSTGLDFTVAQVVDPTFGGARNHFRRSIGRSIHFQVKPDTNGNLAGTFSESIVGLFAEPVTTSGTTLLTYQPTGQDPQFTVAPDLPMPSSPQKTTSWAIGDVFPNADSCGSLVCPTCSGPYCFCLAPATLATVDQQFSAPLYTAFVQRGSNPIEMIADACAASLAAPNLAAYRQSTAAQPCGWSPPLACALTMRTQQTASDDVNAQAAVALVSELLAPSLLVAKNLNVQALTDSFGLGISAERQDYDNAIAALDPVTTWVLQPSILEYLRSISAQAARGPSSTSTSTQSDTYPAARQIGDLLYTLSTLDGERARIGAASASGNQPQLATEAQQRAVLTYLEALSLTKIVETWGSVPDSVASHLTGLLTPLDNGFAALAEGANAFGVPAGYVPFVYRPEDSGKGATNFEQMLALAATAVNAEATLETQFLADKRTYETNEQSLQAQLTAVRSQYDLQIKAICGTDFDPDSISAPTDWQSCGANNEGDVGALGIDVQAAQAKVQGDQTRIEGQRGKIQVDTNALAQTQQIHAENVDFISSTGDSIAALDFTSGMISAAQQAIQVASNASVMNFGAPLGEATVTMVLGAMNASISAQKDQLQTAQSMHLEQSNAAIEYVNAMAAIQKEVIDLGEMTVDILQDQLAVLEQQVLERNKVEQAKGLWTERAQVLSILQKDPSNDPSYRLLRDQLGLQILSARAEAQRQLYLASSALQYEINMSLGPVDGAVLNASNQVGLASLSSCLLGIYNQSRIAYGSPQSYATVVSVRQMLGISGPRVDSVTGQTLTEGDQFRELLLRNENLDGNGGVGVVFATDLQPGNQLWAADVCSDRIASLQAQLVGDYLGDNQAQVNLSLGGGSVMRACDSDALVAWSVASGANGDATSFAVIGAGVNTYGDSPPNTSLFGQSVARAAWRIVIPGAANAPSNSDIDLTHVDDIVLKFTHAALPRRSSPVAIDASCLAQIGGGR